MVINYYNEEKMSKINSFEDLIVWQKAIDLSVEVYKQTRGFPKDEIFGLTSQIKRASNSISLNIAEGSVKSTKTFINHLYHSRGSSAEVLSAAILANKLDYLELKDLKKLREQVSEVTKILNSFINSLEKRVMK